MRCKMLAFFYIDIRYGIAISRVLHLRVCAEAYHSASEAMHCRNTTKQCLLCLKVRHIFKMCNVWLESSNLFDLRTCCWLSRPKDKSVGNKGVCTTAMTWAQHMNLSFVHLQTLETNSIPKMPISKCAHPY